MNWTAVFARRDTAARLARRKRRLSLDSLEERSLLSVTHALQAEDEPAVAPANATAHFAIERSPIVNSREDARRDRAGRASTRRVTRALHQAMAVVAAAGSDDSTGTTTSRGDFNGDGYVSRTDLAILARNFGRESDVTFADGDLNGDGFVDLNDVAGMIFGPGSFGLVSPGRMSRNPVISWSSAAGAVLYQLTVESAPGCEGNHVVYQTTQSSGTSVTVTGLPNGTYYACIAAIDDAGYTVPATNSSWQFEVGFEPSSVISETPGLLAWWDAGFGLTLDENNHIEKWLDRSGHDNDLQQQDAGSRPQHVAGHELLNEQPAVRFDKAAGQFLSVASAPLAAALSGEDRPYEICIVYRRTTRPEEAGVTETLLGISDPSRQSNYIALQQSTTTGWLRDYNFRRDFGGVQSRVFNRPEIVGLGPMIRCDSSSGTALAQYAVGYSQNHDNDMRTDVLANAAQDVGSLSPNTVSLGALQQLTNTAFFEGAIAEVVVFDRRLSELERVPILTYLEHKYFEDIRLPSAVPGLANHWDATTIGLGIGEAIDVWQDTAGAEHFVAAEGSRPTLQLGANGRTVVEFDGVDDAMLAGLAGDFSLLHDGRPFTAFVLYRATDAGRDALEPLLYAF